MLEEPVSLFLTTWIQLFIMLTMQTGAQHSKKFTLKDKNIVNIRKFNYKNKRKQAINDYNYENAFLNNMFENEPVMTLLM